MGERQTKVRRPTSFPGRFSLQVWLGLPGDEFTRRPPRLKPGWRRKSEGGGDLRNFWKNPSYEVLVLKEQATPVTFLSGLKGISIAQCWSEIS